MFTGRGNNDVEAIQFLNSVLEHMPLRIDKLFPHLTELTIENCKLEEITRNNLIGFKNLKRINITGNELQSLPLDLFVGMRRLSSISFKCNKLEFLSSSLLDPIAENLQFADFRDNLKLDAMFSAGEEGSVASLEELMDIIDENCEKPVEAESFANDVAVGINELWLSGKYSDFSIIAGSKEFCVHRNVLSIQSSVFAAVFDTDMKERRMGKMMIEDFRPEAVKDMLHFMYTGEVNHDENAMDLYALASRYEVLRLKPIAADIVLRNTDQSNAIEVFSLGHLYSNYSMKRLAFKVIKLMFPGENLDENLIRKPEMLENLVNAVRKIEEAQKELELLLRQCKK